MIQSPWGESWTVLDIGGQGLSVVGILTALHWDQHDAGHLAHTGLILSAVKAYMPDLVRWQVGNDWTIILGWTTWPEWDLLLYTNWKVYSHTTLNTQSHFILEADEQGPAWFSTWMGDWRTRNLEPSDSHGEFTKLWREYWFLCAGGHTCVHTKQSQSPQLAQPWA